MGIDRATQLYRACSLDAKIASDSPHSRLDLSEVCFAVQASRSGLLPTAAWEPVSYRSGGDTELLPGIGSWKT
jgi:hypothetical protein